MNTQFRIIIAICFITFLISCASTQNYKPVEKLAKLKVSFSDSKWDGKVVPKDEVCFRGGANGASPELKVEGVPKGANAIVVEFNDSDYAPLSSGGGHGAIWVLTNGQNTVTVPSVPTESDEVPPGVNVEHKHRGHGSGILAGVYLAPCSNGKGNAYFADIKAVFKAGSDQEISKLLAEGRIDLGRY